MAHRTQAGILVTVTTLFIIKDTTQEQPNGKGCVGQILGVEIGGWRGMVHGISMSSLGTPPFEHLDGFTNPEVFCLFFVCVCVCVWVGGCFSLVLPASPLRL